MTPVFQTNIHNESTNGNCMRASLASLFELKIDDIPKFENMKKNSWRREFNFWLKSMNILLKEEYEAPRDNQFYISIGMTNRGVLHCVVSQSGKMIHDPHPSQDGLENIKKYWLFKDVK
jgi:hypothetical protein